jgi:hypothetical protein
MKILTVVRASFAFFPAFYQSAIQNGYDVNVLGWGNQSAENNKIKILQQACEDLESLELGILVINPGHTIVVAEVAEAERRFLKSGKSVLISIAPPPPLEEALLPSNNGQTCFGQYVDATLIMGYGWALKQLLRILIQEPNTNNDFPTALRLVCQGKNTSYFTDNQLALDAKHTLFHVIPCKECQLTLFKQHQYADVVPVQYTENDAKDTCFITAQYPASTDLTKVIEYYGLEKTLQDTFSADAFLVQQNSIFYNDGVQQLLSSCCLAAVLLYLLVQYFRTR